MVDGLGGAAELGADCLEFVPSLHTISMSMRSLREEPRWSIRAVPPFYEQ